jgi:putative toxin-antitoxin system antitoxin component (TIGR02293 family)
MSVEGRQNKDKTLVKAATKGKRKPLQTEAESTPLSTANEIDYASAYSLAAGRTATALASVLPMLNTPEYKLTSFEKMDLVEKGISKKALEGLKTKAKLDYDQLSKALNVARATLINKKGNDKFNQDISDKIVGLADLYSYGYEVFEDRDRFNDWIFRPNKALGNVAPFELLHTSFGREEVKNLIGRIDYGIYS